MSADSFLVWTEKWFAHPSPQPLTPPHGIQRYDELVLRFPHGESLPTPVVPPAAAAIAANIAAEAIGAEPHPGGATVAVVQCFGRQTVWCTVALLRRVLREAHWPLAQPAGADAEASLASLAVATVSAAAFGRRAAAGSASL